MTETLEVADVDTEGAGVDDLLVEGEIVVDGEAVEVRVALTEVDAVTVEEGVRLEVEVGLADFETDAETELLGVFEAATIGPRPHKSQP